MVLVVRYDQYSSISGCPMHHHKRHKSDVSYLLYCVPCSPLEWMRVLDKGKSGYFYILRWFHAVCKLGEEKLASFILTSAFKYGENSSR